MINLQCEYLPCPPFLGTAAFHSRMRSRWHRWGNRPGQAEQTVVTWCTLSYLVLGLQSDFFI